MTNDPVVLEGSTSLTIEDILDVAQGRRLLAVSRDPAFVARIHKGRQALERLWQKGAVVYGVTTGVGDSCVRPVPSELSNAFATNLFRFHGCGLGDVFDPVTSRAVVAVRLASLQSGYSGVRFALLEALEALLDRDVVPVIPQEGSVGASGDLTPLSYLAALLCGEREAWHQGVRKPAAQALADAGLAPIALMAKEALAIMNGTAVMTAVACGAFGRAQQVLAAGTYLTALVTEALGVNKGHFDARIFAQKPHPGQAAVAAHIARLVRYDDTYRLTPGERIQATYAVRCAPHVLGVLADTLPFVRTLVETEINSTNDNPLIDPDTGDVLHGGNFYGGHVAMAMDTLKTAVANVADLCDRQVALLVNERRNNGLPANLSGVNGDAAPIHHGFKAVHIATSAMAAEALKLTMPASVFSRSTESHNQDKVSMGTIAARDCIRVLELTEQVAAAALLAAAQAWELRAKKEGTSELHPDLADLLQAIRTHSEPVAEDRPLEADLRALTAAIRSGALVPLLGGGG